jgi:opacity protein-like surface antigen
MKKLLILASAFVFLTAAAYPQSFTLKISGGYGYANGGDLATGIQGTSDYLAKEFQSTGSFAIPRTGVNIAGEFVFYPWTHLGIGIGGGYFQTVKQSSVSYTYGALGVQETIKPQINVVPLTLNLHWNIFLASWLHLDVYGGPGLYATTLKWSYGNAYKLGSYSGSEAYTFQASKSALGWQGGLGLEILISSRMAIVVDFLGRTASIGPFQKGAWTDQWSGTLTTSSGSGSDHTFWF